MQILAFNAFGNGERSVFGVLLDIFGHPTTAALNTKGCQRSAPRSSELAPRKAPWLWIIWHFSPVRDLLHKSPRLTANF